jgi:hypothetical protein
MTNNENGAAIDLVAIEKRANRIPLIGYLVTALRGKTIFDFADGEDLAYVISELAHDDIPAIVSRLRAAEAETAEAHKRLDFYGVDGDETTPLDTRIESLEMDLDVAKSELLSVTAWRDEYQRQLATANECIRVLEEAVRNHLSLSSNATHRELYVAIGEDVPDELKASEPGSYKNASGVLSAPLTGTEKAAELPKRVRVVKASKPRYWYASKIDYEYDVIGKHESSNSYIVTEWSGRGLIDIADCEPVTDTASAVAGDGEANDA